MPARQRQPLEVLVFCGGREACMNEESEEYPALPRGGCVAYAGCRQVSLCLNLAVPHAFLLRPAAAFMKAETLRPRRGVATPTRGPSPGAQGESVPRHLIRPVTCGKQVRCAALCLSLNKLTWRPWRPAAKLPRNTSSGGRDSRQKVKEYRPNEKVARTPVASEKRDRDHCTDTGEGK